MFSFSLSVVQSIYLSIYHSFNISFFLSFSRSISLSLSLSGTLGNAHMLSPVMGICGCDEQPSMFVRRAPWPRGVWIPGPKVRPLPCNPTDDERLWTDRISRKTSLAQSVLKNHGRLGDGSGFMGGRWSKTTRLYFIWTAQQSSTILGYFSPGCFKKTHFERRSDVKFVCFLGWSFRSLKNTVSFFNLSVWDNMLDRKIQLYAFVYAASCNMQLFNSKNAHYIINRQFK